MRRHIPGLHSGQQDLVSNLDGIFLVRVESASYRWHPQKPFFALRFCILEPTSHEALSFTGRLYCTERALWKLNWFLRDFEKSSRIRRSPAVRARAHTGRTRQAADRGAPITRICCCHAHHRHAGTRPGRRLLGQGGTHRPGPIVGGGLILAVRGGTIAEVEEHSVAGAVDSSRCTPAQFLAGSRCWVLGTSRWSPQAWRRSVAVLWPRMRSCGSSP